MSSNNKDFVKSNDAASLAPLLAKELRTEDTTNPGRRKIARLGVGAPLVLTLASRSVLAGQCLSNMLSGNLSDPNRNSFCNKGWSPGGWGNPGGQIDGWSTKEAWYKAGFKYGKYDNTLPNCSTNGSSNQAACYTGGSKISDLGTAVSLNISGAPTDMRIRDLFNSGGAYQNSRHLICAYFNAKLAENTGKHYILTSQQVLNLASGAILPPPIYGNSISDFLDDTWT